MKKKFFLTVMVLAVSATEILAVPVGSNDVARAMGNWRHRRGTLGTRMGETVRDVRRVEADGVAFHVVRFTGGGHVIAPADTTVRPVVMFSGGDDFDANPANPALALIVADLKAAGSTDAPAMATSNGAAPKGAPVKSPAEREWAELLDDDVACAYTGNLDDVRVGPIVKARWGQGNAQNGYCYNYYTPKHAVCGCVATSLSQIIHFFKWPKGDVSVPVYVSRRASYEGVVPNPPYSTQGGRFDWDNMPDDPSGAKSLGDAQRMAIGKLTSDIGIMLGINYTDDGSGGYVFQARRVLMDCGLGYSNAAVCHFGDRNRNGTEDDFVRAAISNFDAKLPVQLSIVSGHAVLGDGYGYNGGQLYFHLNMGWSGSWDYWYSMPVDADNKIASKYTGFHVVVYNIYTNQSPDLVIASGRVTDKVSGNPVANQRVVAFAASDPDVEAASATTDANGIYALYVKPGDYTVTASKPLSDRAEYSGSTTASPGICNTAYTLESDASNTYHYYGKMEVGNVVNRDIEMVTVEYEPEAVVSVGEVAVGRDFAEAVVPVTAKVVHFGQTATRAKVVVTLTSDSGRTVAREFDLGGDFGAHEFSAAFGNLTAGEHYDVTAKVVMNTAETAGMSNGEFAAAREFTWFDESAASFSAAKWTGAGVSVREGKIRIDNGIDSGALVFFRPDRADLLRCETVVRADFGGGAASLSGLPVPDGRAAVSALAVGEGSLEVVVWGSDGWMRTGQIVSEDSECEIGIDIDRLDGRADYRIRVNGEWKSLGGRPVSGVTSSAVSEIRFGGTGSLASLVGTATDSNLVRDASGSEYATFVAARDSGATGTLTPLWFSTWNLSGVSGMFDVSDPRHYVSYTGDSRVVKTEVLPDGSERKWYAQASDADIVAGADKYIKTTVDLGLAKAITDDSMVRIGDYLVTNGEMSFIVEIDDVAVTRDAIKKLVQVKAELAGKWGVPTDDDIRFENGKVIVTPNKGGASGFARVKIPAE